MELAKEIWQKHDIEEFDKYLLTLSKGKEKSDWEQRIINTKLPCISVQSVETKRIIKEIGKGNYISYIDHWLWKNFTHTAIIGGLICKIKEFETFKKYLNIYSEKADNWATCDVLTFPIKNNYDEFLKISKEYVKSNLPFRRRIGLGILMKIIDRDEYIDEVFQIMNSLSAETEYYVNMMNSWLFAECFTKQRDKTIKFLQTHMLNKFTINKGISKCRDSYRVSKEDKEMLLKYKAI